MSFDKKKALLNTFFIMAVYLVPCALGHEGGSNPHKAWLAYIDPGSGHLLLQLMIAFLASCFFYMKSIVRRIKKFVTGGRAAAPQASETAPSKEEDASSLRKTGSDR